MKTKILYLVLLVATISQAQIPTTNLVGYYEFSQGSLTDNINNVSFTKTGTASSTITDRFGNANEAISLNGDDLTRSDIEFDVHNANPYLPRTISFWVKTATNDANVRDIYNDNDKTTVGDINFKGLTVILQNGNIKAINRVGTNGNVFTHPTFVADNKWHHVVIQGYSTLTYTPSSTKSFLTYIFIDGVKIGGSGYVTTASGVLPRANKHVGNISFSKLKTASLPANNKYQDGIDDISLYTRVLTDNEILSMSADRGEEIIYVNANASGNNSGQSWADAKISLSDALNEALPNSQIWMSGGTYKPDVSDRSVYFNINKGSLSIYGGFSGTETQLSDRVIGANQTILSGDLNNNDVNTSFYASNYSNTTRNTDNSYHIINITASGNNLLLDGLTISDAHNNLSTTDTGGAILKEKTVANVSLINCIVRDNVSRNANAGLFAEFDLDNATGTRGKLNIENCQFINNMSRWASSIYSYARTNTHVDVNITNTLFRSNITNDLTTSVHGISGSAGWFRMLGNNSDMSLNFTGNTLANNVDSGSASGLNETSHAVLAISKSSGFNGTLNAVIANTIFWRNKTTNNAVTRAITDLYKLPVTSVNVYNSIDEENFNDSSLTSSTNSSNSDPLFTNWSGHDYTLQSSSPAKDSGNNSYVSGAKDLLGNQRIFNTTVDMGAFEFGSTLGQEDFRFIENELTLYPNPTSGILTLKMAQPLKQAEIYSVLGTKVMVVHSTTIDASQLSNGIYMIKVEAENGAISTKRFIKN